MSMRSVGLAVLAALAGCGAGGAPEADGVDRTGPPAGEERASRFEVSVDTQRIATPDSEVPPSENAPD
jgi:hypothetical protein